MGEERGIAGDEAEVRRRTGGRSARVREAVLRAALEILTEQGIEGLTFSEIGRRAGVHGTSVQRRWGSRENILLEALISFADETIRVPNTGALRTDLSGFTRSLSDYFNTPFGGAILKVLVADTDSDRAFAVNRAEFVRIRHEHTRAIVQRARERGEIRPGVDDKTILGLLLGPIYVSQLVTREPMDDAFIERLTDALMRGVAVEPPEASETLSMS
jgi:AcrR family transcriptional regulator